MKLRYSVLSSMLVSAAVGGIAVHALHAQAKPPVYAIALNQVTDAEGYAKEYCRRAGLRSSLMAESMSPLEMAPS
jgi:hypothetical protein